MPENIIVIVYTCFQISTVSIATNELSLWFAP